MAAVTLQTGCICSTLPEQIIHLREKNIAGPTERSRRRLAAYASSREGPAFFDEDDVCAGNRNFVTACLNRYAAAIRRPLRGQYLNNAKLS